MFCHFYTWNRGEYDKQSDLPEIVGTSVIQ